MREKGFPALDGHVYRLRLRGSAMVGILTADGRNAITINVDGQLVDDCVDALERCSYRRWVRGDRSISSCATFLISMNTAAPSCLASLGKAFDRAPAELALSSLGDD